MEVIRTGDIERLVIADKYVFPVLPKTTCTIRPSLNKFPVDTEIKSTVNNLGVRNFQTSKIATCGFNDLEIVVSKVDERILQIIVERQLLLPVLLELSGGLAYSGELYIISQLEIDAIKRTTKISMAGNHFIAMEKRKLSLGENILNKLNELPK